MYDLKSGFIRQFGLNMETLAIVVDINDGTMTHIYGTNNQFIYLVNFQ